ncbi:uncharacterized protein LOC130663195 [Microplitis mediator]|uniref:uncharacterized protein LOC130663195 n=1 Tax=Microplitis mediator TaxID=375433 RepID=UPI0025547A98|nr:uncharacterized protein LOC130663195 [Microplitis mediator]
MLLKMSITCAILLAFFSSSMAGIIHSAPIVAAPVVAAPLVGYAKAVPHNIPPHASRIDINTRALAAPYVVAPAAPVAVAHAAPVVAAPPALIDYTSYASPLYRSAFIEKNHCTSYFIASTLETLHCFMSQNTYPSNRVWPPVSQRPSSMRKHGRNDQQGGSPVWRGCFFVSNLKQDRIKAPENSWIVSQFSQRTSQATNSFTMMTKCLILFFALVAVCSAGIIAPAVPAALTVGTYASSYNAHAINHAYAAPYYAAAPAVAAPLTYSAPLAYSHPLSYSAPFTYPAAYAGYSGPIIARR